MAPMEPWARVWIDALNYEQDIHSYISCIECHGGQDSPEMDVAHSGMVDRPAKEMSTCGDCHTDIAPANANSLHSTLRGYDTVLNARSTPENHPALDEMQANHCASCHTTCGDCHISQPFNVGGGLLKGHTFVRTPPMTQTCTACHGSRVQNEYFGLNEGYPSDVHFRERMNCVACHTGDEIHGVGMEDVNHRYDGAVEPSCESCHQDQIGVGSGIEQHEVHGTEILSCQTCHSVSYTNCTNCHVEQTTDGVPFFTVESHEMNFMIGKNPIRSAERPYRYVTLRHVPADVNAFSFYGENLQPNFDALPTWAYSTPHNIQRQTPQNQSCESCHTNDSIFLTEDKVAPAERNANRSVITNAPELPRGYVPAQTSETPAEDTGTSSGSGDFWGGSGESAPATPESTGGDFWGAGETAPATATPESDSFWGG